MKFSIVIPSWNGKKLLEINLPAVLACKADEVIITDDGSTDETVEFIKHDYPQVKIFTHKRVGFAGNCNQGVRKAKNEVVVLLNTDVIPREGLLENLKKYFIDEKIFAISFNEINNPKFSWTKGGFEKGFIVHSAQKKDEISHKTFWASGGSGAFRRKVWRTLGGMDELFNPFYWEDIDICYRAQKRGWQIIWAPDVEVEHKHEGIIKESYSKNYIDLIWQRNQLLFIWKNLTDKNLFQQHLHGLFRRLKNPGYLKVFLTAVVKVPFLIPKRLKEQQQGIISDKQLIQ